MIFWAVILVVALYAFVYVNLIVIYRPNSYDAFIHSLLQFFSAIIIAIAWAIYMIKFTDYIPILNEHTHPVLVWFWQLVWAPVYAWLTYYFYSVYPYRASHYVILICAIIICCNAALGYPLGV